MRSAARFLMRTGTMIRSSIATAACSSSASRGVGAPARRTSASRRAGQPQQVAHPLRVIEGAQPLPVPLGHAARLRRRAAADLVEALQLRPLDADVVSGDRADHPGDLAGVDRRLAAGARQQEAQPLGEPLRGDRVRQAAQHRRIPTPEDDGREVFLDLPLPGPQRGRAERPEVVLGQRVLAGQAIKPGPNIGLQRGGKSCQASA